MSLKKAFDAAVKAIHNVEYIVSGLNEAVNDIAKQEGTSKPAAALKLFKSLWALGSGE